MQGNITSPFAVKSFRFEYRYTSFTDVFGSLTLGAKTDQKPLATENVGLIPSLGILVLSSHT